MVTILDADEHYVMARDIREGMLVDFQRLFRDFREEAPEWTYFEYGEVTDVLSEDVVTISAIDASFALHREHPVVVFGPLPEDYVAVGAHLRNTLFGSLDG